MSRGLGDIYAVVIFASGTVKGYREKRKNFDFIYGNPERVTKSGMEDKHSKLREFFGWQQKKFVLEFKKKEIDKKEAFLQAIKQLEYEMPKIRALFHWVFYGDFPRISS